MGNSLDEQPRWRPHDVLLLELIADGESNKRIAARLALSESAVKKRIVRLERRLDVSTRVALVRAAFDAGLLARRTAPTGTSV